MAVHKYFDADSPPAWRFTAGDGDIVIKSGVYLARNFKDFRFPHIASATELRAVAKIVRNAIKDEGMEEITMNALSDAESKLLADKRIIANCFINKIKHRFLHVKNDGKDTVAVNEEDHVLIAFKREGLGFFELLEKAFKIDDLLDEEADIAYDENYGYLTSLPARVGTGMRAAALLHLPAIAFTKNIKATAEVANKLGIDLISLYGHKDKEWQGNLFLVTNHKTIGFPEVETVKRVETFAREIAASERKAREALEKHKKNALEDVVWRSYGLLERGKALTEKEALDAASKLQIGSDMGIIKKLPDTFFGELFTVSRASYLRNLTGIENEDEIDRFRAIIAGRKLQGVK